MMKDNKIKSNYASITLPTYTATSYDESLSSSGYVSWGRRNDFPEYLWGVYSNCSTLQSIINGYTDYTCGNSIVNNTIFSGENTVGDTIQDIYRRVALDRWVYGGFAYQVFYNKLGEPISIAYVDVAKVRVNSEYTKAYMVKDFNTFRSGSRSRDTLCFDLLGCLSVEERAEKGTEICFHKGLRTKGYYPVCDYVSALISAEIQIEIKKYHYNNISNGMLSGTVFNFNNAENVADEVKEQIEEGIKTKFTGSGGAGEIIISWNEDKEHELSISKLEDDNFDSKFNALSEDTRNDLFISMRASPPLFGLAISSGFNEQEFNEAFNLANRTSIQPVQGEITRSFNRAFGMGGYSDIPDFMNAIEVEPFSISNNE